MSEKQNKTKQKCVSKSCGTTLKSLNRRQILPVYLEYLSFPSKMIEEITVRYNSTWTKTKLPAYCVSKSNHTGKLGSVGLEMLHVQFLGHDLKKEALFL